MAKADSRALSQVARELLQGVAANQYEPLSPAFIDGAMSALGGARRFGQICTEEFNKARGLEPDGSEPPVGVERKASAQVAQRWGEMLGRIMLRIDERETAASAANLSEDDLISSLKMLAIELAEGNNEFRDLLIKNAVQSDPDLLDRLLTEAGSASVKGKAKLPKIAPSDAGLDEKDACDE